MDNQAKSSQMGRTAGPKEGSRGDTAHGGTCTDTVDMHKQDPGHGAPGLVILRSLNIFLVGLGSMKGFNMKVWGEQNIKDVSDYSGGNEFQRN